MALDDIQTVNQIVAQFQDARRKRRPLVDKWNRNRRIVRNRTWGSARASWLPSPAVPEIFPIIATSVGWMTDQRPILSCNPETPAGTPYSDFYAQVAQDMTTCLQVAWNQYFWDSEIEKVIWDGYEKGIGIVKTTWDATLLDGMGDVRVRRIDPFYFFPDPRATSFDDAEFFVEARNITLKELERRFPGSVAKLGAAHILQVDEPVNLDTQDGGSVGAIPGTLNNPSGAFGQTAQSSGSRRWGSPSSGKPLVDDDDVITYIEHWQREIVKTEKRVYVQWRVRCVAGDLLLMDEPATELWSHGRHPYSFFKLIDTGDFWGTSMVELLAPSQMAINRLLAALQQNVELVGNPVFVEDSRSNISRSVLTNRPGQRVMIGDGGKAEWLTPPQIHPMMSQLVQFYISEMERISGLSAMQRGFTPTGRNSTGVLDSVQEAGFVRIRMALRNLERCLRDFGNLAAALISEYYTAPRIVQTIGPSDNPVDSQTVMRTQHFYSPGTSGEDKLPLRFNVMVDANSQLPTSRQAKIAEADVLYSLGVIDRQAVLDAHEWPNRQAVLQRVTAAESAGMLNPPTQRQGTRPPSAR